MDFEIKDLDGYMSDKLDSADLMTALKGRKRFSFFIQKNFRTGKILKKIKGAKSLVVCTQSPISYTLDSHLGVVKKLAKHVKKKANIVWNWQVDDRVRPESKLMILAAW